MSHIAIRELFACNSADALVTTTVKIPGTPDSIWVVDNVYRHPEDVRHFVLQAQFGPDIRPVHPGLCARASEHSGSVTALFRKIVGVGAAMETRSFFARLGSSETWDRQKLIPHTDNPTQFAALIHLTRKPHELDGTSFFRHRKLNLWKHVFDNSPATVELAVRSGFESIEDFHRYLRSPLELDEWEELLLLPARFNRMVLYPSAIFHAPSKAGCLGYEIEHNPRLTQNLFFSEKVSPGTH